MKMCKKGLALLLALLMLATALPFGGLAVLAEEVAVQPDASAYPVLPLDTTTTVTIAEAYDVARFTFTPAESGAYVFYSLAPEGVDTKGAITDGEMRRENDDGGEFNNFRLVYYMTAGVQYELQAFFFGEGTGSYPVRIERTDARMITAVDFSNRVCLIGDRREDGSFHLMPHAIVTYTDGSVQEYDSDWIYDDLQGYEVIISYDVPMQTWVEGGVYTVNAEIPDLKIYGSFTVSVQGSPVASVTYEKEIWIEGYHGWMDREWITDEATGEEICREFWRYDDYPNNMVITLKDGSVFYGTEFDWNGQHFWMEYEDTQCYATPWGVGVHTVSASIAGFDFTYEVEVIESPVASVVVEPITVFENADGYWAYESCWDDDLQQWLEYEYYYYENIWPRAVITLKDGSVWTDNWIEWNGFNWGITVDGQDYENHLTKGTNTWHGNLLGYEFTYEINVVDSPVASVTADTVTLLENYNGYWDYDYHHDEFGNEYKMEYFYYHNVWPQNMVITLKDGTVIRGTSFEYNGKEFGLSTYGQSYENRLQVGMNTMRASIAGYEFTLSVEVLESPVASVTAQPVTLIAHQNGYWKNEYVWDEETQQDVQVEYFYYSNTTPAITVTLKDGTVINGGYFEWNGMYIGMSITNQWYENRLLPGKNIHTGAIGGYEFEYVINIATIVNNETYEYMETEDGVIITECYELTETLTIPATIDGKPVVGVAGLGRSDQVRHLILPDSVVTFGEYVLENFECLESIHFGAGVTGLTSGMFTWMYDLQSISISADNANFCVVDGALYDKAMTTFIAYPVANGVTDYEVPATVVNINALDYYIYRSLNVTFAEGHLAYKAVDGVVYDKDMTTIISVRKDKSGAYVMPDTVETITQSAFKGTNLTSVVVSPKVTQIVYCTFANCASLESVTLPEGLVSIEMAAFENTPALQSIELPSTLEYIGTRAFDNGGLTALEVPGSVVTIDYAAFRNTKIETLVLNEGIREIYSYAFAYTPVRAVALPDSLQTLGYYAFGGCRSLEELDLGGGITYIGDESFANTALRRLYVPANVGAIGERAFAYTPIEELILSEGLCDIYSNAFYDCNNLTAVHLPSTLGYMGTRVFGSCDSLRTLTVTEGKYYFGAGNCVISHGGTLVAGCNGSDIPQDGSVQRIEDGAFYDLDGLESIDLPEGLKHIGDYAFYECDALSSAILPDSVTYLGIHAFAGVDNLRNVQMGDHIEFMGSGAFSATALEEIDLGDSVPFIAPYAFQGTALQEVFFPSSVTEIMYEAFAGCSELTAVEIPVTVTSIEEYAFEGCDALTDVYYQGTEADRDEMNISRWGNEALLNATWHYEWTNDNWAEIVCEHVYDNACDVSCNLCGDIREVVGHVYDNACDGECNVCGDFRTTPDHQYIATVLRNETCGADGLMGFDCSECGAHYEEILPATGDHAYDNACDGQCNVCGDFRTTPDHQYIATVLRNETCGADGLRGFDCSECGAHYEEILPATGDHTFDNACDAYCNGCDLYRPVGDHVYDNACDAYCNICDAERVVGDHRYDHKYDADCNVCGAIREVPLQPAFTVLSGNAIIGETVDVWVDVEHNSGIAQAVVDMQYDTSVLELVAWNGGVFDGVVLTPNGATVNIAWSADADNYVDGTMARFTFRLKDGVTPGSTAVSVSYTTAINAAGEQQLFLTNDRVVGIYANVRGDADGDGQVSTRDLAEMIQDLNGWDVQVVPELLDVDADGKTTNRDYVMINRHYNGWDIELQ